MMLQTWHTYVVLVGSNGGKLMGIGCWSRISISEFSCSLSLSCSGRACGSSISV